MTCGASGLGVKLSSDAESNHSLMSSATKVGMMVAARHTTPVRKTKLSWLVMGMAGRPTTVMVA